jgi:hypothetical protein
VYTGREAKRGLRFPSRTANIACQSRAEVEGFNQHRGVAVPQLCSCFTLRVVVILGFVHRFRRSLFGQTGKFTGSLPYRRHRVSRNGNRQAACTNRDRSSRDRKPRHFGGIGTFATFGGTK